MSKLFQIYDDDLAALEQTLPEITKAITVGMDNAMRAKIRRVQTILTNVRWNYGPHTEVERVDDK